MFDDEHRGWHPCCTNTSHMHIFILYNISRLYFHWPQGLLCCSCWAAVAQESSFDEDNLVNIPSTLSSGDAGGALYKQHERLAFSGDALRFVTHQRSRLPLRTRAGSLEYLLTC